MSQQINLLDPIFRKKSFSFTSATAMLYGIGIAAALTTTAAFYESYRGRGIEAEARAVARSLQEAQKQHDALLAQQGRRKPDAGLEARVLDLGAQFKARQEIVEALKGGLVGTTSGFSEYMRAFSRQRVDGVWLTAFDIASGGVDLTIAGRALSADLVPAYLQRLNREAPMQGRQFASIVIHQAVARREGSTPATETKEKTPSLPPYLDFTISSGEAGMVQARSGAGAEPQTTVQGPTPMPAPRPLIDAAKSAARPEAPQ